MDDSDWIEYEILPYLNIILPYSLFIFEVDHQHGEQFVIVKKGYIL